MKVFCPKRDKVTGKWKRLLIEELYDLYPSPNMTRVIKSIKREGQGTQHAWQRKRIHTGL